MTQIMATGFSSKLFTIRPIIMKFNGKIKRWKWRFTVIRRTTDYFVLGCSVPLEIIACPLFLAGSASLFMSFLKYYKKPKITFSIEQLFSSNSVWRRTLLYCFNIYIYYYLYKRNLNYKFHFAALFICLVWLIGSLCIFGFFIASASIAINY